LATLMVTESLPPASLSFSVIAPRSAGSKEICSSFTASAAFGEGLAAVLDVGGLSDEAAAESPLA
jgi:hypothetical protein